MNSSKINNNESTSVNRSSESVQDETNSTIEPIDILTPTKYEIDPEFVLEISKENNTFYKKDVKDDCKILTFSSNWSFDEIVTTIASLNPAEYPHLFAFVINLKELEPADGTPENKVSNLKKNLLEFSCTRPLIAQVSSEEDYGTTIFFKDENSMEFQQVDSSPKSYENIYDFPSFLFFIMKKDDAKIEYSLLHNLQKIQNLSLILRYLRACKLSSKFVRAQVLECAKTGPLNCFLASLDASFEGLSLSVDAQSLLSYQFCYLPSENELAIRTNDETNMDLTEIEQISQNLEPQEPDNDLRNKSVLLTAMENENVEVIEFLITNCTHLIQELPFEHKVEISTAAFKSKQLNVLCDLLEISDFPFPEKFNIKDPTVNERLLKIAQSRENLEFDIKEENLEKISEFIDENLNLKHVYNLFNESAMKQAIRFRNYKVYFHLHSLGLEASEFDDLQEVLTNDELRKANKYVSLQRMKNVKKALGDKNNSINLLCTRSYIHNRKINKQQEKLYRQKIRQWYGDICEIRFGSEFLNAVSLCEKIKIIFDFNSDYVNQVSLSGLYSTGSTYPIKKWIFIAAKLSNEEHEHRIKGVLAHELCHYLMRLIYENNDEPYYKHDNQTIEIFKNIVDEIDKWSTTHTEYPDDECNRIISSVYKLYRMQDFPPELIVRVVQILTVFYNDEEKLQYLQKKYNILFEFWEKFVIPDIQQFNLTNRQTVRSVNKAVELLPHISNQKIELVNINKIDEVFTEKSVVITTNIPLLLLVNIYNCLKINYGDLLDAKNIFIQPKNMKNSLIKMFYKDALDQDELLNIIVDCSKQVDEELINDMINGLSNFIFVASNSDYAENLIQRLIKKSQIPKEINVVYSWDDLDEKSRDILFEQKVNFQNNCNLSFFDLLMIDTANSSNLNQQISSQQTIQNESSCNSQAIGNQSTQSNLSIVEIEEQKATALEKFSKIVDTELLNLLIEKKSIAINTRVCSYYSANDETTKYFEQLYQPRKLIKKQNDDESSDIDDVNEEPNVPKPNIKVTQDQLLSQVDKKKYVLISDIAGTGKSWMMKFVAKIIRERIPKKWTTYVDLKLFIEEFTLQKEDVSFECFIADKILKPEQKFEGKLFIQLYKDGKVCILFDGFDELPQKCINFVEKLIKSFEFNNGNQMWISTRDHFEVDLKEIIGVDEVYEFEELSNETNINLIASSWIMYDSELQNVNIESKDLAEDSIKNAPNFKNYQTLAKKLLKRFGNMKYRSIGYPDFCKFLAEHFKNDKEPSKDVTTKSVSRKFSEYQTKRSTLRESATDTNFKF